MKTSVLVTSVGAGLGTLGGGGLLVRHLLKKETVTVGNKLTEKGHEFLSFEEGKDLDTWKAIAKAYTNSTKHRLSNVVIAKPADSAEVTEQEAKNLQKECQKLINNKDYKNQDILSAEQWCVKPLTIEQLVGKQRKILDLTGNQDQNDWDTKVSKYLTTEAKNKLPNTTLTTKGTTDADKQKLRDDCNKAKVKKTYDVDFHENYTPFNDWCTLQLNG